MPSQITEEGVLQALSSVQDPDLNKDIVSLNFVRNIAINDSSVSFTLMLTTPACPMKGKLQFDSEQALRSKFPNISSIDITFDSEVRKDSRLNQQLDTPIKNVIAVGSGKGGVGKSTVSVNLAVALAKEGAKVGILDADIYGPNIPMLLGIDELPDPQNEKLVPATAYGVQVMSMGFLIPADQALVWRGPMINSALKQLISDVLWDDLDYLILDLPPGTGDAQLSAAQLVPLAGGIVVTTPQAVAVSDAVRGVDAFRKLQVPVLGIVENMSGSIFGTGGGEKAAAQLEIPFLGRIPLEEQIASAGEAGTPFIDKVQEGEAADIFRKLARVVAARVSILNSRS